MSLWTPRSTTSHGPHQAAPGGARRLVRQQARRMLGWSATLSILALLAGCSFKQPQSFMDSHGLISRMQLDLFMTTVWVCLFIFVTVGGTMAVVVWKYRERPGDENKPMPSQGHGNPLIEISLITASIALLVIIAVPTLKGIFLTNDLPKDQPYWQPSLLGNWYAKAGGHVPELSKDEPLLIRVRARQWWWIFEYPQFGFVTANELYMPAGRLVKFELYSDNVIHSFWLPKIAGKVDCMPGRLNWMWMLADDGLPNNDGYDHGPIAADKYENGLYYGQCAQYCGEAHAFMLFRARVVSDADFVQWVEASQQPVKAPVPSGDWKDFTTSIINPPADHPVDKSKLTAVQRGAAIFFGKGQCTQCHTIDGTSATATFGPNLTRVASRTAIAAGFVDNLVDPAKSIVPDPALQKKNFVAWVTHPQELKPGNLMWYGFGAQVGLQKIYKDNELKGDPMTEQNFDDLAEFLMSLK